MILASHQQFAHSLVRAQVADLELGPDGIYCESHRIV